jgi:hypothetical protein
MSDGLCDLNDVQGMIDRVVTVAVMALTGRAAKDSPKEPTKAKARA